MSGHALVVSGILFTVVGVMGYRNARGLARVERAWSMRKAMSGDPEPRGWEVWLFRVAAAAATALGLAVTILGAVLLGISL